MVDETKTKKTDKQAAQTSSTQDPSTLKKKRLEEALASIKKEYGESAVMTMRSGAVASVQSTPTGSLGLDIALGVGGYPRGRIVEIFGPEASGKTTLTLHAIAECQKNGGTAAFIDVEHALDPAYATALGVSMNEVLLSQPANAEEALNIAEALTQSGAVDLVVIDSVAALVPQAEIEGDMGASHMGLQARLMSQALRKLTAIAHKSNTTIFFINQIRMKIGVMFGSPETTSGGNALKYYSSVRLDIRRVSPLKVGEDVVGSRTRVKVVKNKVAPPFKEVEFDIVFGKGVQYFGELIDIGVECGVVEKSGAWYSCQGERLGQGRDAAVAFVASNTAMTKYISEKIMQAYKVGNNANTSKPAEVTDKTS